MIPEVAPPSWITVIISNYVSVKAHEASFTGRPEHTKLVS